VSRRARAAAFLVAALACAALAAVVAGRYSSSVQAQYGALRPVVVAAADLPAGQVIGPGQVSEALVVRRIPASFAPPGVLRHPQDALGRAPGTTIPAGSYLLVAQLAVPAPGPPPAPATADGLRPVQVAVAGAEALVIGGADPAGSRVDVVVAQQSGLGNRARTFIAATAVKLLALQAPKGPGEGWSATLAVTREQALVLIAADAGGKEVRLLPQG
jgi:Flp pilus assembly protein CpaB